MTNTADIIGGIRQAMADFVAPELRTITGKLEAVDARITALEKTMITRLDSLDLKIDLLLRQHDFDVRLARLEQQAQEKEKTQA
jgi:hypothetical protein